MTDTDGQERVRTLVFWAIGALLTVVGLGLFFVIRDNSARLGALEDAGKAFLKALASGEGNDACSRMTRIAQSELAAGQGEDSCPQAVEALIAPLSDAERNRLAVSYRSRFWGRGDSFGHVGVRDNPLDITELLLSEIDGKWRVAEMK
ncbi:hypothetical protein [Streptomyces triticisoli]|uniref:hypothetical protein n=1 Tax=Streptomyces triticisoli TaxID=2182797 RepID=UPI000DD5FF2E|nr:hypothetical protein [Streptomyces triticisoli]